MEKKDISQLLADYGVYNQSGISAIELDKKLRKLFDQELDKAREEGRKELLDSIIEGVTQLKDLVSMFNPMSPEIRAKQSGEIEAYNGLLEKLSKLTTK